MKFDEKGDGPARYTILNYQKNPETNGYDYKVSHMLVQSAQIPGGALQQFKCFWIFSNPDKNQDRVKNKHGKHGHYIRTMGFIHQQFGDNFQLLPLSAAIWCIISWLYPAAWMWCGYCGWRVVASLMQLTAIVTANNTNTVCLSTVNCFLFSNCIWLCNVCWLRTAVWR